LSLQVKFSRDFLVTHMAAVFRKPLRACGFWSLNRQKILTSPADYWVFVLVGFKKPIGARWLTDFVIITPAELLRRLNAIHGKTTAVKSYLWVTEKRRCWETRGLKRPDQLLIAQDKFKSKERDFTVYLNNWEPLKELNR